MHRPTVGKGKTVNGNKDGWFKTIFKNTNISIQPSTTTTTTPSQSGGPATPIIPSAHKESPGPITINRDDVLRELKIHKRFRLPSLSPDLEVTDLPNFDDITPYDVGESTQDQLWDLEALRLIDAVSQPNPLFFQGSKDLAVDSIKSYGMLAILADRVMQSLIIASYDGESLLVEHLEQLAAKAELENCRVSLVYMSDVEAESDENQKWANRISNEDFFKFVDYCTGVLARVLCSTVGDSTVHTNILAHLAKISTKIKVVSANLRKYAQVSLDIGAPERPFFMSSQPGLRQSQEQAPAALEPLSAGDAIAKAVSGGLADDQMERVMESLETRVQAPVAPLEVENKKKALRIMYYRRCDRYRHGLIKILQNLIVHLRGSNRLTQSFPTSYEICSMVYETGFERFRTLVFQDETDEFLGTSDEPMVNNGRNMFHFLNETVDHIFPRGFLVPGDNAGQDSTQALHMPIRRPNTSATDRSVPVGLTTGLRDEDASVGTTISWNYTPDGPDNTTTEVHPQRTARLRSMSNTISVLVPLVLASPQVVMLVSRFIDNITFSDFMIGLSAAGEASAERKRQGHLVKPHTYAGYTAFFSLTTDEYRAQQEAHLPNGPKSLSNALMRRNNLHKGKTAAALPRRESGVLEKLANGPNTGSHATPADERSSLERIVSHRQELDRVGKKMKSWVFEEKGVMVKCKTYVAMTMLLCVMLVAGGIAIGVTVGGSIQAVDPFNITTYCWVLAAFVLLVVKSVRVHEWPWNDFLHGRVLCKSVSELSEVTGIDEQLILAKLLQDESFSCLDTRGPFNAVFKRRSGDGFSIDRPISMWTMLISGLIMIEVESMNGRGLVCLDLRRGTKFAVIKSVGDYYKCDPENRPTYIYCKRIPERSCKEGEVQGEQGDGNPCKLVLNSGDIVWMRALGFYSNKDALFI